MRGSMYRSASPPCWVVMRDLCSGSCAAIETLENERVTKFPTSGKVASPNAGRAEGRHLLLAAWGQGGRSESDNHGDRQEHNHNAHRREGLHGDNHRDLVDEVPGGVPGGDHEDAASCGVVQAGQPYRTGPRDGEGQHKVGEKRVL